MLMMISQLGTIDLPVVVDYWSMILNKIATCAESERQSAATRRGLYRKIMVTFFLYLVELWCRFQVP